MDPDDVTRLARGLEPLHSLIYFAPEVSEELTEIGITVPRAQYFAQRSAAMGAVGPGVIAATFYNFSPVLVARHCYDLWSRATPADVLNRRLRAADRALRRVLGDAVGHRDVTAAAELVRRATEAATVEDRPLYAAHADLPWPEEPHLALWHGMTLLREHRGDAHLHVLLSHGLSGLEALVTHTATGTGFLVEVAQKTRGWSPEQWGEATRELVARGLVTADGSLTPAGQDLRASIEHETSRLSAAPWQRLGDDGAARLAELGRPLVSTLLANGAFPDGVFAPGSDRARRS